MSEYKFPKKTIKDVDIYQKTVLLRADYNVPLEEKNGKVEVDDTYRIEQSLPTLEYLLEQECKIVIISHLGRPKGKVDKDLSLEPVAESLSTLTKQRVKFVPASVGAQVEQAVKAMQFGDIILLENLRFHEEEKADDLEFAEELASIADIFVQDGFGVVHRKHASTDAVTKYLPSVAGFLIEREVTAIIKAIKHPKKPVVAIVGGAKIQTKIDLLDNFIAVADTIVIGGAMANTFLVAIGYGVGKSVYDPDELEDAKKVLKDAKANNTEVYLPVEDVAVGKSADESAERQEVKTDHVASDDLILDFASVSMSKVTKIIKAAETVLWNGPLGMTELPLFASGTQLLAKTLAKEEIEVVVGGGDTAGFIHELGLVDKFTHVSTGGGASLELMAGQPLPGVEALLDK